ncbi:D-lactate dehydrogenase [Microthyrium microscopicum]|uniref:D-lactate dehydrogenase n=1 Tax=Microthyrium microscopicum TaxID=703497 RepID=A0A6A6TZJ3_9PEZI|nr:D-lactate dehydrogenase [Microthyrium microscopicum]
MSSVALYSARGNSTSNPGDSQRLNGQSTTPLDAMPVAVYDLTEKSLRDAENELVTLLGAERVITSLGERITHSSTEWSVAPGGDLDRHSFIVHPKSTEEVSAIAKICHKRRIPMIAFSGGTSLEGTLAATTRGGCCIDFQLMNKVIQLHAKDMDVVVQPGVGFEELNAQLDPQGYFFPPDPGPGAQIGGMIGQGCSGTNAYRYGTMKDWVLGMTVVLADGTIVRTRNRPRKSSAGYNLTQLMIGSEGTLGIVTEATLKLTSAPRNIRVAVLAFKTTQAAVDTAIEIVQNDMPVAALELLDGFTMKAVNQAGYCDKQYPEIPTLFMKFAGHTPQSVQELIDRVEDSAKRNGCQSLEFSKDDKEVAALWMARKTALWSLLAMKENPEDKFLSADAAVPISRLADLVEETTELLNKSGLIGSCLGHVGDGNFHTTVLYGGSDKDKARQIISTVQKRAIEMEGTITGEHGIGLEYRDMLVNENGPGFVDMMRHVKLALDPYCLLNPDKLFRVNWDAKRD